MVTREFDRITLIHDDKEAVVTDASISLDGDAAQLYVSEALSPSWERPGMDVVVAEDGDVLFAGVVLSIDPAHSFEGTTNIYACLAD